MHRWPAVSALLLAVLCAGCGTTVPADADMPPLAGTRWVLVELRGQTIAAGNAPPYLFLQANGTFNGNDGCNGFAGSYTRSGPTGLRLEAVVGTLMACTPEPAPELQATLAQVDNFTQSGNQLALNRARMAPLAIFRAVPRPE